MRLPHGFSVGVGTAIGWVGQESINRRIRGAFPNQIAIRLARRQLEIMLQEPQQRLARASEFRELRKHQANRLLHAAVGVLLQALVVRFHIADGGRYD